MRGIYKNKIFALLAFGVWLIVETSFVGFGVAASTIRRGSHQYDYPGAEEEVYVEYTHIPFVQELGDSFSGSAVGVMLFLLSLLLVFWNEGRAVRVSSGLDEAVAIARTIPSGIVVNPELEGSLVHSVGLLYTDENLADNDFVISLPSTLRLRRRVETFQWKETHRSDSRTNYDGSRDTQNAYNYSKVWREKLISSSVFKLPNHRNPSKLMYPSIDWVAQNAKLGLLTIPPTLVEKLQDWQRLPLNQGLLKMLPSELHQMHVFIDNDFIHIPSSPSSTIGNPQVGDTRISFYQIPSVPVTVIGGLRGGVIVPFSTSSGSEIEIVKPGVLSPFEVLQGEKNASSAFTWFLRVVGFILNFVSILIILEPVVTLLRPLPFFQFIAGVNNMMTAAYISTTAVSVTLVLGWLSHRLFGY